MGGSQSRTIVYHDEVYPKTEAPNNFYKPGDELLMKENFYYKETNNYIYYIIFFIIFLILIYIKMILFNKKMRISK